MMRKVKKLFLIFCLKKIKQNDNLVKLIKAQGQRQPAVMTADGFLINGNRRKLALDRLYKESSQNEQYRFLKVVILPGSNDAERPTYQDIAKLENRYGLKMTVNQIYIDE